MSLPPEWLATAIEAVLAAGEMQARQREKVTVRKKGEIDLVTDVDLEVERYFRALIGERFPHHDVLAEELTQPGSYGSEYCWIFDPLDGTTNFAHGLPFYCASLALEVRGRIEVAAVYDPCRRELFTAERGGGAYVNGRPLKVSAVSSLIDSLLVTGFPYTVHTTGEELLRLFGVFVRRAQAVRRLGSAALDLCYVAAGRMDGFWERGLNSWDMAAGALIVEEAGGRVTGMDGGVFDCRAGHILASNGLVHDEMAAVIRDVTGNRDRDGTQ